MNKYTARSYEILAIHAEHTMVNEGSVYSVWVKGTFLCDEDTYDLRVKIEKELKRIDDDS